MPYPTLFHVPLPSLGRPYLTLFLSVPFSLTDQIQQDPNKKPFNSDPHSPTNLNANSTISLQRIRLVRVGGEEKPHEERESDR